MQLKMQTLFGLCIIPLHSSDQSNDINEYWFIITGIVERYILKEISKFCALPWMNDLDSPIITVDCGAHG